MKHMAIIALAPGQVGYYDDLSGLHLSLANREARVLSGMNTAGLVNAVRAGKITVVSGSLGSETLFVEEDIKAIPTYYRLLDKKKKRLLKQIVKPIESSEQIKTKEEAPIVELEVEVQEEVVAEEAIVEEVVEETPAVEETPVEEAPAPKKRSRKKKEAIVEEVVAEEE